MKFLEILRKSWKSKESNFKQLRETCPPARRTSIEDIRLAKRLFEKLHQYNEIINLTSPNDEKHESD